MYNSKSVSIRCEQSSKEGSGLDVWLGRLAMVGFAAAISVEIVTGKGLIEVYIWLVYGCSVVSNFLSSADLLVPYMLLKRLNSGFGVIYLY